MTQTHPTCIACGMPMRRPEDHSGGDPSRDWCHLCTREDGRMVSYDEALAGVTGFLVRTQGLDRSAAEGIAARTLAGLPAWRDREG